MSKLIHWAGRIGVAAAATTTGRVQPGQLAGRSGDRPFGHGQAERAPHGAADGADRAGFRPGAVRPGGQHRPAETRTSGSCRRARRPGRSSRRILRRRRRSSSPGRPLAPGGGQTDYQKAQYAKRQKAWQAKRTADLAADAAQTRANTSAWLAGLDIRQKLSRLADPPADQGSLAAESAVAASAMAGLEEEAGNIFGHHRVIVLFCDDLSGALPAGELTGDDVIVVAGYLPTAAAASAAQVDLLRAGAAQAAVVGSEVTAAQLAGLVSADLSEHGPSDSVSAPVLFGNNSYALSSAAVGSLTATAAEAAGAGGNRGDQRVREYPWDG